MALIPYQNLSPFREFFGDDLVPDRMTGGTDLAMDVYEKDGDIIAKLNLPGIDPDDVDINLDKNRLTVSGEYSSEKKEGDDKQYSYRERRFGSFSRSVRLPAQVDDESTEANYEDGVLTISMPKVEADEVTGRKIDIKRS